MTPVAAAFQSLESAAVDDVVLARGAIIRVIDPTADDRELDVMVVENAEAASRFSIMPTTGYKAGIRYLNFPVAARVEAPRGPGISAAWLHREWTNWYDESRPQAVFVASSGYRLE